MLFVLPDGAGRALLGDTWPSAAHLLPATGSQYAVMALGTCGLLALRVLSPRATLPIQVVFSLTSVCCLLGGYADRRCPWRRLGAVPWLRREGRRDLAAGGPVAGRTGAPGRVAQRSAFRGRSRNVVTSATHTTAIATRPAACSSGPRSRMKPYPATNGTTTASTLPGPVSSTVRRT